MNKKQFSRPIVIRGKNYSAREHGPSWTSLASIFDTSPPYYGLSDLALLNGKNETKHASSYTCRMNN
jgi:hypothetical protein